MRRLMIGTECLEWIATPDRSLEGLEALRVGLRKVKPLDERRLLERVLDSHVLLFGRIDAATMIALEGWAQYKLHKNEPHLAGDIYRRIIVLAKQGDPPLETALWYRALARAHRDMGDYEGCRRVYDDGLAAARREGNAAATVLLQIGHAGVYRFERRLYIAEQLLQGCLAAARAIGDGRVESRASHDAGVVASELAVQNMDANLFFAAFRRFEHALPGMPDDHERQRLRIDIARAAAVVQRYESVQRVLAPVLERPCERRLYVEAVINAMHAAQLAEDWESFDRYRLSLKPRKLPLPHRAIYWETASEGLRRSNRGKEADEGRLKATSIARRVKLRQIFEPTVVLRPPAGLNAVIDGLVERIERDERESAIIHHGRPHDHHAHRA